MSDNANNKCSRCGSKNIFDTRYTACVAKSKWCGYNWPMPNREFQLLDDIKIWAISLCNACRIKGYVNFLRNQKKRTLISLGWDICAFLFSCIVVIFLIKFPDKLPNPVSEGMTIVVLMVCLVGVVLGLFGIPKSIVKYIKSSAELRKADQSRELSAKQINDAFIGEAQRVWEELERGNIDKVYGEFQLPKYKTLDEYDISADILKSIKGIRNNEAEKIRDVSFVADTYYELNRNLPSELTDLL